MVLKASHEVRIKKYCVHRSSKKLEKFGLLSALRSSFCPRELNRQLWKACIPKLYHAFHEEGLQQENGFVYIFPFRQAVTCLLHEVYQYLLTVLFYCILKPISPLNE